MSKIKKVTLLFIVICLLAGVKCFAATGTVNAPSGLVLRKDSSRSGDPITTVNDKQTVEILETLEEWYKVKYNNYEGYLYKQYVDVNEEEQEETVTEEQKEETENTETQEQETESNINEQTVQTVYPKEATTKVAAKIYLIPSFTGSIINNIEEGKTVTITQVVNSWAYITSDNISGWIRKGILDIKEEEQEEKDEEEQEESKEEQEENTEKEEYQSKKGYVNVSTAANVRKSASTSADVITTLTTNTEVTIVGEEGDWYKITYGSYTGYISKQLLSDTQVTVTSRSNVNRENSAEGNSEDSDTPVQSAPVTDETLAGGEKVADLARQYVGNASYVYGGTTPSGFDCSGFVYYIYNTCGYSLSRSCGTQASSGVEVSRDELQPGDILFFNNTGDGSIGHVGIYLGGGTFAHAANPRRGVTTDTINSGYYNTYYYTARRIIY